MSESVCLAAHFTSSVFGGFLGQVLPCTYERLAFRNGLEAVNKLVEKRWQKQLMHGALASKSGGWVRVSASLLFTAPEGRDADSKPQERPAHVVT